MASYEYITAAKTVDAKALMPERKVHFGVVHSKSSLFAREYQFSLLPDSQAYMDALRQAGVLATEMECAQFFTLGPILSARMEYQFSSSSSIYCGAILAIIGDESGFASDKQQIVKACESAIQYAIQTTKALYRLDQAV
jgi:uridine phosphorylase